MSEDEERRKRTALVNSVVSSSPDKVDNDDGFADFLTLLATQAAVSTPLNKKNDTINNNKEDVNKYIAEDTNDTTTTPNNSPEEEQRIKQFNKTLEQIMIRKESSSEDGKQQQPTSLPEAFYKNYSMTLPKTLKGSSSKKKHSRNSS